MGRNRGFSYNGMVRNIQRSVEKQMRERERVAGAIVEGLESEFWAMMKLASLTNRDLKRVGRVLAAHMDEFIEEALNDADRDIEIELPDGIDGMDGWKFEEWCADLLSRSGFEYVQRTSGSGDQGADIIATMNGEKWAVQCKNHKVRISNKAVQEASAAAVFYQCSRSAVMTNRTFTPGAIELAMKTGTVLFGRGELARMLKNAGEKEQENNGQE